MCNDTAQEIPVLHSTKAWLPLTENWLFTQASFLPEPLEVHVICETTLNQELFGWPRIYCYAEQPRWKILRRKILRRLQMPAFGSMLVEKIREHKIQLLHSHFGPTAYSNHLSTKSSNIKHVATFYGYDVNRLPSSSPKWRKRYLRLFDGVEAIFCEGSHMARAIEGLGCPKEKLRIQHLGIDPTAIPLRPRTWRGNSPLKILIAASFREKKGIPYAIKTLGQLQKRIDIQVTIIGDATQDRTSQREKEKILDTIRAEGLVDHVRLLGYQPHDVMLQEAYEHHIFLAPSVTAANGDTEGGAPVVITEMMATGMPIVSTRHCDIPEVIGEHSASLLAEERDVDGLVDCILNLASRPTAWKALAHDLRARVECEYNAAIQGQRLAKHYLEILG